MSSLNIDTWTPGQVSNWIKGLGSQFEAYYESFVDEEITGKALLTINNEYLKELSIESVSDQNVILDAVHCLVEVDTCLQSETVHGQVVIVNDKAEMLIEQLEKEGKDGDEGDVETSENSIKGAGQVYQLAKKLLSWLIRSPFSEMNACWPLKDSVCRVVRDMTDESLLKNRGHLQENLKKLQTSFDNFLNDDEMHEVFKQPPILKTEEITLEGEGLGIGITTSHNIHTVNSVTPESPAGKNKNIKNGDEIVNVNNECVIAWPQKNVVALMKSNADSVRLTLKKLPPVEGPLNKPVDKPGTPLSEMEVIMDRTRITAERTTRAEMKEAGIKEETSLEMQAIENEDEVEETMDKVEERVGEVIEEEPVEVPKEETDGKETEKEGKKDEEKEDEEKEEKSEEKQEDEEVTKEEGETKIEEEQKEEKSEEIGKEDETEKRTEEIKEDEKEEKSKEEKQDEVESEKEGEKVEEKPEEKVIEKVEEKKGEDVEKANGEETEKSEEGSDKKITVITDVEGGAQIPKVVENLLKSEDTPEKESATEETKVDVDLAKEETEMKRDEEKTIEVKEEKEEVPKDVKTTIANGEPSVPVIKIPEENEKSEPKNGEENAENKAAESNTIWYDGDGSSATANEIVKDKNAKEIVKDKNAKEIVKDKNAKEIVKDKNAKEIVKDKNAKEIVKDKNAKEIVKDKNEAKSSASAEVKSPEVKQNGEAETLAPKIEVAPSKSSPEKKPQRPELPKMKIGSVKNVTVKGANTKQVELFSTSKVVRREKKVDGAPSKRISCIDLGEADCEGWLTKKSGGHGLTPTRWKRHWCVLKDGHLYYYKTSFDREAGGVIEITGYNMSTAPEIKKSFAFKCEKEGAKKYFFHADNEVDREKWVKSLNSTSRGEKKQKDLGSMEQSNGDDRKPGVLLKAPASTRPRTSSVLAGIRFNYYDEELGEQSKAGHEAPSASATAKRVNDSVESGQREESKNSATDDTLPSNDILKIAVPVEEDTDTCQVIPVAELQDNKGTEGNSEAPVDKSSTVEGQVGTSEVKSEAKESEGTLEVRGESKESEIASEEKRDSEEPKGTSAERREPEGTSGVNDEAKEPEVASDEKRDSEEPKSTSEVKGEPVEPEGTPEVKSEARGPEGTSEERSDSKESEGTSGEEREPVEPEGTSEVKKEPMGPEGTTEGNGDSREREGTSEDKSESKESEGTSEETMDLKGQEDTSGDKSESTEPECTSKDNGDSKGPEDTTEDKSETEGQSETCDGVDGENEKAVSVAENVPEKVEAGSNSDLGVEEKGERKNNDVSKETRETDAKKSGEGEAEKDEFTEVAESIKEADVNIDGSERPSAQALMRRLSTNSKGEIMDKVVKLRILKQSLKDKEQSMDAIDELLSSDVNPETIAEWRTKFQTVVESSTSSSDLNENSHL